MKMRLYLIIAAALISTTPLSALSDAPEMPIWMTGAWEYEAGESWADEYWTPLRGDMMIGASRSGAGDTLKFWEHMRIQKEDDGGIALWIVSADQKPVRFEATLSMENRMAFENEAHDYPQRIEYWREGNELKAEISLLDGSKPVLFHFTLQ